MRNSGIPLWLAVAGVLLASAPSADAYYTVSKQIREDGHLKMWWTKDGIRITEYPFIDSDFTTPTDCYWIAPTKQINDCHEQWIRSGSGKKTSMSVVTAPGHPVPTFDEYFVELGSASVSWYTLADADHLVDVEVDLHLLVWGEHLKFNPMPPPQILFPFTDGLCSALPGHFARNEETGQPFTGLMSVTSINTLAVSVVHGDFDEDRDVDLADFAMFAACFNGPNRPPAGGCTANADLDNDDDVDLADFAVFAACFNGPNRPPADGTACY